MSVFEYGWILLTLLDSLFTIKVYHFDCIRKDAMSKEITMKVADMENKDKSMEVSQRA